jgi:hypothetical protein
MMQAEQGGGNVEKEQFEIQNTNPGEQNGEAPREGHSYLCVFDIRPNGIGTSHSEHRESFKTTGRLKTNEADAIAKIDAETFANKYLKEHPNTTCSIKHLYRCIHEEPVIHIYPQY